jgi:magnesium chelatase subunit D
MSAMMLRSIPELSPAWADALAAARLVSAFGRSDQGAGLAGIHLRARPGPALDCWLAALRALVPDRPVLRISSAIDPERLSGGLDLAATLEAGRPVFEPGLLARADGAIVVLAMAERTGPHLAAIIGDAMDKSVHEGRPSRFVLVAIDEGAEPDEVLCRRLSDRLPIRIDLSAISNREAQSASIAAPQAPFPLAGALLPEPILSAFGEVSLAAGPSSMRLALNLSQVARALASLDGVAEVSPEHAAAALRLVLGVQLTAAPPEHPPEDQPPEPPSPPEQPSESGAETTDADEIRDMLVEAAKAMLPDIAAFFSHSDARRRGGRAGKAGKSFDQGLRGKAIGHLQRPPASGARPDIIATLRVAAPWQRLRGRDGAGDLQIRKSDFRYKRRSQPTQSTTIFAVDASGSTALDRLGEAKGAVELLLADCYVRRDEVALIAFRGTQASILLEPTRSLVRAKRSLATLPGGGATPLAGGLMGALQLAEGELRRGHSPLVVVLTDGSGNVALDGTVDREAAARDCAAVARQFALLGIRSIVIDISRRERETSRSLAQSMHADYCRLPRADAAAVSSIVAGYRRAG